DLFYCGNRSNTHVFWLYTGMSIGDKSSHRLQSASLGLACFHQHDRCSGIVDAGCITRSDTSTRLEGWTHLRQLLQRGIRLDVLVSVEDDRFSFNGGFNRQDLVFEVPCLDCSSSSLVALQR